MNETIEYYNKNAEKYIADTQNVDFEEMQSFFLKYMKKGATILDLGCGSGRDSKAFREKGYSVVAVDGSAAFCEYASKFIGQEVRNIDFTQLDYENAFDGVWACASLLHLSSQDLAKVLSLIIKACKKDAYIYMSFKYGDFEGIRNERYFTYMNEQIFASLIQGLPLKIVETKLTGDVREDRATEYWFNVILLIRK